MGPGGVAAIQRFWQITEAKDPEFFSALELDHEQLRTALPMVFHEDGVRFLRRKEAIVVSWSSQMAHGHSLDTKHVIAVLPAWRCTAETETALLKILSWSVECARQGGAAVIWVCDERILCTYVIWPNMQARLRAQRSASRILA